MLEWLALYWWVILGVAGSALYVAWQMRVKGAKGPFVRRQLYALAPALDPTSETRKALTPRAVWLVLAGLGLVLVANALVALLP